MRERKELFTGCLIESRFLISSFNIGGFQELLHTTKKVMLQIEAMCRRLIWSGQVDRRCMPLVKWENVCLPKREGGLGIKQLVQFHRAALGKHLWDVISNANTLWSRWAQAAYLKGQSIWQVKAKGDSPWSWRKLLKLRESFKEHVLVMIGDGRRVSLFFDAWLDCGSLSEGQEVRVWGSRLKVAQWWQEGWVIPGSFIRKIQWIADQIQECHLSTLPDKFVWKLTPSGQYSVSSFYNHERLRQPKQPWTRGIWCSYIPQQFHLIVWLLMHDRLQTKTLLKLRGMNIDDQCELCS